MSYTKFCFNQAWWRIVTGRSAAFGIVALVLVAAIPLSPADAAGANDEPVVQAQIVTMSAIKTYWTEERMSNARPMPTPRVFGAPAQGPAGFQTVPAGPAVIANSGKAGDSPTERVVDFAELSGLGIEAQALPGPFAFSGYRVFPNVSIIYQQFPYAFVGKVFFTIPGQGDFVCSGAVVNAPNLSLVWTAGHCVYSAGIGFHTNFVFEPARHELASPRGFWTANTLGTPSGWADNGLWEYDHGAAFMNPGGPGAGDFIIGQLGFLGFGANLPRQQHWHLTGYPAEPPFDGEHQHLCATNWAVDDQPSGTPGTDPKTIGVGCHMTGGSSGGAWVLDFGGWPGFGNIVNGNVSYGYIGVPNELYGPFFGDAAINLRDLLGNM
jgi:hypothetical protein